MNNLFSSKTSPTSSFEAYQKHPHTVVSFHPTEESKVKENTVSLPRTSSSKSSSDELARLADSPAKPMEITEIVEQNMRILRQSVLDKLFSSSSIDEYRGTPGKNSPSKPLFAVINLAVNKETGKIEMVSEDRKVYCLDGCTVVRAYVVKKSFFLDDKMRLKPSTPFETNVCLSSQAQRNLQESLNTFNSSKSIS